MKKLVISLAAVIVLFAACKEDILFPNPGLDQYAATNVKLRRDTADSYTIKMHVSAEAGVEYIRLLNGRDFSVIREFEEYRGSKYFDFEYVFDFAGIPETVDTTLIYTLQVRARDNRGSNKSVKIDLRKRSVPEVFFTNDIFFTGSFICALDCKISTGLNTIKKIDVYMDGQLVGSEQDPRADIVDDEGNVTGSEPVSEYVTRFNWAHEYVPHAEYDLRVEVTDDKGQIGVRHLPMKDLGPARRLNRLKIWAHYDSFVEFDEKGRCCYYVEADAGTTTGMGYGNFIKAYWYEDGPHEGKMKRLEYSNGGLVNLAYFDFKYDENGHLMDFGQWRIYPARPTDLKNYSTYTNIKYRDNGTISEYTCNGTVRKDVPFIEGFIPGEYFGAEDMRQSYRTAQSINDRRMISDFIPVENPAYMPGIPCIIDWDWSANMAFYYLRSKYFFTRIVSNTAAGSTGYVSNIQYTLNSDGLMERYHNARYYYEGDDIPPSYRGPDQLIYFDYGEDGQRVWSYSPLEYHWEHHADDR